MKVFQKYLQSAPSELSLHCSDELMFMGEDSEISGFRNIKGT